MSAKGDSSNVDLQFKDIAGGENSPYQQFEKDKLAVRYSIFYIYIYMHYIDSLGKITNL